MIKVSCSAAARNGLQRIGMGFRDGDINHITGRTEISINNNGLQPWRPTDHLLD